jgi:cytochrome d ubiquinol oxidase subunit I
LIISIAAYYLLKKRHTLFAKTSMKVGLIIASVATILQLISADHLAEKVSRYNPEKFAAFEGVYKTAPYTPAYAFGWVDAKDKTVYGLPIPGMLSWMTYGDAAKPVPGLDQFPENEHPWVPVVFQTYHLMILTWIAMAIAVALGLYHWWKKKWRMKPIVLKYMMLAVTFPQIGNIAGWYTSCIGRQPWVVYKLLKTNDAYSPIITSGQVIGSLIMFILLYLTFFVLFLMLLDNKIKAGPDAHEEQLPYRDIFKD